MPNHNTAPALGATQIIAKLVHLNGWRLFGDGPELAIEKEFMFDTHTAAAVFVGSVAMLAERHAHFPDIAFTQARCIVRWRTTSVQGISQLDFDSAARVDALSALL